MTPATFLTLALRPACLLLGPRYSDPRAEVLLLAICLQESGLRYRRQIHGPARGFAQFEVIGVEDVLTRVTSRESARALLATLAYPPLMPASLVHEAMTDNDILTCGMARLNLWNVPLALPTVGAEEASFRYYVLAWKPGAAREGDPRAPEARRRWSESYTLAMQTVGA